MFEIWYHNALLRYASAFRIWVKMAQGGDWEKSEDGIKKFFDLDAQICALKRKAYQYGYAAKKTNYEIVSDLEIAES